MDNHKLLKEIGASLEALAGQINALASPAYRGVVSLEPGGPLVASTPCQEVCYNCNCRHHGRETNSCMAWAICVDRMPEDFKEAEAEKIDDRIKCNSEGCPHYDGDGRCANTEKCTLSGTIKPARPCNEPCDHPKCTYAIDQLCVFSDTCGEHSKPPEKLLRGYTLAQWDEIRKGGYLCQFGSDGKQWGPFVGSLDEIVVGLFVDELRERWNYCRPAQIPGVLRPWFGGDCQFDPSAKVLVKFRDGGHDLTIADNLGWGRIDSAGDIIAYMEV